LQIEVVAVEFLCLSAQFTLANAIEQCASLGSSENRVKFNLTQSCKIFLNFTQSQIYIAALLRIEVTELTPFF